MSQTIDVFSGQVIKKPPHATSVYPLFYQQTNQKPHKLFEPINQHPQFQQSVDHHYDRGFWDGFDAGPIAIIQKNPPLNNRSASFYKDSREATQFLYPRHRADFIKKESDNLFKKEYMNNHNNLRELSIKNKTWLLRKSKENTGKLFSP